MKKYLIILMLWCLWGCESKDKPRLLDENKQQYHIIVASDLHHASQNMTCQSDYVEQLTLKADGKQLNYLPWITEALVEEVLDQKPDLLILSGDLSLNGEKENHQDLVKKLKEIEKHGTEVLVIPGNHDINSYRAIRLEEEKSYYTQTVTAKEFEKLYHDFGYGEAYCQDEASLSYVYRLSKDFEVVMLDTSCYELYDPTTPMLSRGEVKKETLSWLEEQFKEAKEHHMDVFMVTHHNLLVHQDRFYEGFTIDNAQEVVDLCLKYGVKLNLSGHTHIQNIASYEENDQIIYDISSSALSIVGNQYGLLNYRVHDSIDYEVVKTDVEAYAKKCQSDDENLLNFHEYSYDCFEYVNLRKAAFNLFDDGYLDDEETLSMATFNGKLNAYYFMGRIREISETLLQQEAYQRWKDYYGASFNGSYMNDVLNDHRDHLHLHIDL